MEKLGMEEGQDIESRLISRAIENAQSKVEQHNFEIRKRLLEYDDVMNKQRTAIYNFRSEVLQEENQEERVKEMIEERISDLIYDRIPEKAHFEEWDLKGLKSDIMKNFYCTIDFEKELESLERVDEGILP
jgi:preprotein translocase subunit SecA